MNAAPLSNSDVRLVQGSLHNDELIAIAVAVSAMSAASQVEAHQRELMERSAGPASAWGAPEHRLASAYPLRAQAGAHAWKFSHR